MLSALLPGVREVRTPLVAGSLWAACLWLLVGPHLGDSEKMSNFIARFHLDAIPPTAIFSGAILLAYLVGSLLVVRKSPFTWVEGRLRRKAYGWVERLDVDEMPRRRRFRPVWRAWQGKSYRRPFRWLRRLAADEQEYEAVDHWLRNQFSVLSADGRVPVMRSFEGGCGALTGFLAFFSTESVDEAPHEYFGDGGVRSRLAQAFVGEIKNEKAAVEVRIQMRYPEVYAEIDRLKVEAELRLSIFWPLCLLSLLLAWALSPFALALLSVPPFMAREAFQRIKLADGKTWSALVAGEVSSPTLDAMEAAMESPCLDFRERYQTQVAESDSESGADLRLASA